MDQQYFSEELQLLGISFSRIFRLAVNLNADLPKMPYFAAELVEEVGEDEVIAMNAELDEAKDGRDHVTAELAKWKEELAA